MNYCEICFVNLNKEPHKEFCPNRPTAEDIFGGVFGDIFNPKDKNKNEDREKRDSPIND